MRGKNPPIKNINKNTLFAFQKIVNNNIVKLIFIIMLKNIKIGKTCILLPPQVTRTQTSLVKLPSTSKQAAKRQICDFIANILDFDEDNSKQISDIQQICLKLNKEQVVQLWNEAIKIQLDKFIAKINCLLTIKKGSVQTLRVSMIDRISKCSLQVKEVLEYVSLRQNWCLCGRQKCTNRFRGEQTQIRLQSYCLSKLNGPKQPKTPQAQPIPNQFPFLHTTFDEYCNLKTLQQLEQRVPAVQQKPKKPKPSDKNAPYCDKTEQIIASLSHMKITQSQRITCYVTREWVLSMRAKINMLY